MRALIVAAVLIAVAPASAEVTVRVDVDAPLTGVGPVPREMVGLNMPVHTDPAVVARAAVTPDSENWRVLRQINPGLIRQWINAPECGLHGLDLPPSPDDDAQWEAWLREQLAPASGNWAEFDAYMRGLCALGDGVQIMVNEPVPPLWLGPFRWEDRHAGEVIDLRSDEVCDYERFVEWCGLDGNRIGNVERFERLRRRFSLLFELLARHILADPVLREHATMFTLGNETDSGGEFVQNSVRWRMWVYGAEANERFEAGLPIRPIDEGVLQGLYMAMYEGVRAADPAGRITLGGPETSWSHNQFERDGRFWYLDWFIDGVNGVSGIGRERIDFITWHNYGYDYDYSGTARQLYGAYRRPTYLTEYNATAAGHGMNFMQRGAQTVAKAIIELSRTEGARGACFFKASGGGFGLILNRGDGIWRTGAFFALKLIREQVVGGRPVRTAIVGDEAEAIDCLAVRRSDGRPAALLCNTTARTIRVRLQMPGDGPMRLSSIELPLARERNDYRSVLADEIEHWSIPPGVNAPSFALAPHGVLLAVREGAARPPGF